MRLRIKSAATDRLYGRAKEIEKLQSVWASVCSQEVTTQVVCVHGKPGSGKTSLCQALGRIVSQDSKGTFVSGKFDQFTDFSEPYSAIASALHDLADVLLQDPNETPREIIECLKNEGSILTKLVPKLAQLLPEDKSCGRRVSAGFNVSFASERLAVATHAFLTAFCSPERRLALFVDDLQWADRNSMSLMQILAADDEIKHFLLLIGYRNDSDNISSLDSFFASRSGPVTDVPATNLDLESLNDMLADVLLSSGNHTLDLANIVVHKTGGNPFNVITFLNMLERRNLLTFNIGVGRWDWDTEKIRCKTDVSDDIATVIAEQLQSLPSSVQNLVNLASCLGFYFDTEILRSLSAADRGTETQGKQAEKSDGQVVSFDGLLERAIKEGLIEVSNNEQTYKFSHDRVRECAYGLLPDNESRRKMHLMIGRHVRATQSNNEDDYLFLMADQFNRGSFHIETDAERRFVIELNLTACEAAKTKSSIALSADFLCKARALVRDDDWETNYLMTLELFTVSAELELSLGHYDEMTECVDRVCSKAATLGDTARVIAVKGESLGARNMFLDAIRCIKEALQILGKPLPPANVRNCFIEYYKTKKILRKKSDKFFDDLPPMKDQNMVLAMKLLRNGTLQAFNVPDLILTSICYFRGIRHTVKHGRCVETPWSLAGYGFMLSILGHFDQAFRFSEIAMKQIQHKASVADATMLAGGFLTHLRRPAAINVDTSLNAYRAGLQSGDMANASLNLANYGCLYVLFCGHPLKPIVVDMKHFARQIITCHQDMPLCYVATNLMVAMCLSGEFVYPLAVSWDELRERGIIGKDTVIERDSLFTFMMLYCHAFVAYVMGDNVAALNDLKSVRKLPKDMQRMPGSHFFNYFAAAMDGLIYSRLLRVQPLSLKKVNKSIKELTGYVKRGSVDCVALLKFVQAERTAILCSNQTGVRLYDDAIALFARSGMPHFCALANEAAGLFLTRRNSHTESQHYFGRAVTLYNEWDAVVKVAQMKRKHRFLQSKNSFSCYKGKSVRGRARFDAKKDMLNRRRSSTQLQSTSIRNLSASSGVVTKSPLL